MTGLGVPGGPDGPPPQQQVNDPLALVQPVASRFEVGVIPVAPNVDHVMLKTASANGCSLYLADPDTAEQLGHNLIDAARRARTGIVTPPSAPRGGLHLPPGFTG